MVKIVSDTSTMYSSAQAEAAGFAVSPLAVTINGETYYGKTVDVNMKDMAAAALASGDATIIAAVNEMMTKCGVSAN